MFVRSTTQIPQPTLIAYGPDCGKSVVVTIPTHDSTSPRSPPPGEVPLIRAPNPAPPRMSLPGKLMMALTLSLSCPAHHKSNPRLRV